MKNSVLIFLLISLLLVSCQTEEDKADAYGNFEVNSTIVSSTGSGKLKHLDIEEGKTLESDALIAIIDTTQLHLQKLLLLSQKRSINDRAIDPNPEIEVFESQLENIQREKSRIQKLVNAKAATGKQLDDINGEIEVLLQRIAAAKANAKVTNKGIFSQRDPYNAQIDLVNAQIADCYIKNPIKGVVLNKLTEVNEIVSYGTPLYTIADTRTLVLRAYTDAINLQRTKVGDEVSVGIDDSAGLMRDIKGTVSWISNEAEFTPKIIQTKEERVNLVYAFKVNVPNPEGILKIGMPAEVNFSKSDTTKIPRNDQSK